MTSKIDKMMQKLDDMQVDVSTILADTSIISVSQPSYTITTSSTLTIGSECKCCGRNLGLPSGSRGLCDGCEEDIPSHIPQEQYLTYMKELWRKK